VTPSRRRTESLDGDDWQIRPHLGLEAALTAARRRSPSSPAGVSGAPGDVHAVHTTADAAAGWLPARVPGSVADDLLRAGEIEDVYTRRNSRAAEWVAQRAWTYRRSFDLPRPSDSERAWLRFDGIDHAAVVFLDGAEIARHSGMFVPLEIELDGRRARGGRHDLAVVVEPAPHSEPQVGRTSRVRVHKSRMTYGWDFCPRLVHQGLWQSVSLTIAGPVRIGDVWARPVLADDLRSAIVELEVGLHVGRDWPGDVVLRAELIGPDPPGGSATGSPAPIARSRAILAAGAGSVRLELAVERPALWWPAGHGTPALHRLVVRASVGHDVVDERAVSIGFRRIERHANPGARSDARPCTFVVNDRPVEISGWNWTPLDVLYGVPRPDRLEHLLRLAVASHANMLRVWGGGLIETEAFYDACDRLGILVWQEFSQSSSGIDNTPSADPDFVERMRREAEAIVPLRRNHPSLAIWCGGNELQSDDGRPLEDADSAVLEALHGVVRRLDPDRIWLPTSPSGRTFHNGLAEIEADPEALEDVHGPWEHQGLREHHRLWDAGTSLFNGEFGVEGMTNRRAHERLIAVEDRWPADRSNPIYRHLGDWWNNAELVQAAFGNRLGDLEQLRRASQWLQAEGLRYAVEANRRRWPRNSGSLPWQLNESYPNAWCTAVVDHHGDPKPAFYAVSRACAPTLVCASFPTVVLDDSERLPTRVVAWSRDGVVDAAAARVRIVGTDGTLAAESITPVDLDGQAPVVVLDRELQVPAAAGPLVLLDLTLATPDGAPVATNRYVLATGSDLAPLLDLAPARLAVNRTDDAGDWCLRLSHRGGPAAIGVSIADDRPIDDPGWAEPDDSGFSLLPGESRNVRVRWASAPEPDRRLIVDAWNVAPVVVT